MENQNLQQERKWRLFTINTKFKKVTRAEYAKIKQDMKKLPNNLFKASIMIFLVMVSLIASSQEFRIDVMGGVGALVTNDWDASANGGRGKYVKGPVEVRGVVGIGTSFYYQGLFLTANMRAGVGSTLPSSFQISAGYNVVNVKGFNLSPYWGLTINKMATAEVTPLNTTGYNFGLRSDVHIIGRLFIFNDINYATKNLFATIGIGTRL